MARVSTLALLAMTVGCAKNGGEGMVILENTAPAGTTCMLTGDTSQPAFSQGEIFSGSTLPYILTPLIESRITALTGQEPERTILLTGANVSLTATNASGAAVSLGADATFSVPISGSIPPGGTVNVSFAIVPTVVLAKLTGSGDSEVLATVTVLGTEGGGQISAEPFIYGVTVGSDVVVNSLGGCNDGFTATVRTGNPCNVFQDGAVDCCLSGSAYICPAVAGSGS